MSDRHDRPIAISLLLGASGWFAGLFLLVFVGALFRPDSAPQAAVCGVVLLAAAWGLFKVADDGAQLFVAQLALALSIAGQCLMLFALSGRAHGIVAVAQAALVLQVVLALVMPNRLHRTLSTLFACIAWALTVRFALVGTPEFGWSSRAPQRPLPSSVAAIAAWLVAWLPIVGALGWMIHRGAASMPARRLALVEPIASGLSIGLAFATVASQPFESWRWLGAGEADAGGLALWPLLSALGALAAVAASFARRRRGLMALCVVAALLHVSHFYYALGTSLLTKSVLMLAMGGIALLAARAVRPSKEAP